MYYIYLIPRWGVFPYLTGCCLPSTTSVPLASPSCSLRPQPPFLPICPLQPLTCLCPSFPTPVPRLLPLLWVPSLLQPREQNTAPASAWCCCGAGLGLCFVTQAGSSLLVPKQGWEGQAGSRSYVGARYGEEGAWPKAARGQVGGQRLQGRRRCKGGKMGRAGSKLPAPPTFPSPLLSVPLPPVYHMPCITPPQSRHSLPLHGLPPYRCFLCGSGRNKFKTILQ